jgi:hypothetical protein
MAKRYLTGSEQPVLHRISWCAGAVHDVHDLIERWTFRVHVPLPFPRHENAFQFLVAPQAESEGQNQPIPGG